MKKHWEYILGIVLLVSAVILFVYRELKIKDINNNRVNIHSITNSGSKESDVNVYLKATFIAGGLASLKNDKKNNFYVVFGDDVQYIVYMSKNEAKKINRYLLDNPDKTYEVTGVTKLISKSMEEYGKEFVKNWLDTNHEHEEIEENEHIHEITNEDFYTYFGYVYLDTMVKPYRLIQYLTWINMVLGIVLIGSKYFKKIY